MALTLGHFHAILSPMKSKLRNSNQPQIPKAKIPARKKPISPPPPYEEVVSTQNGSLEAKKGSVDDEDIFDADADINESDYIGGDSTYEDFEDEESDTEARENLDYSLSDLSLSDEDDSSVVLSDSDNLQSEPEITSRTTRVAPFVAQPKDDSVDVITEIIIKKMYE